MERNSRSSRRPSLTPSSSPTLTLTPLTLKWMLTCWRCTQRARLFTNNFLCASHLFSPSLSFFLSDTARVNMKLTDHYLFTRFITLNRQLRIVAQEAKGKSDAPGYIIQNVTQAVYKFPVRLPVFSFFLSLDSFSNSFLCLSLSNEFPLSARTASRFDYSLIPASSVCAI